jgi:SAM-dependent methyltransferase
MQGYSEGFARIYNMRWGNFAQHIAPRIQEFYESTPMGQQNKTLLDLCCGTGQLAQYFLALDYHVTGLDLSPAMLRYAQENTAAHIEAGQAMFVEGDAANFTLDARFGLVISTFDALNHLPDMGALQGCFRSAFEALEPQGWFIFDLNTRVGVSSWTHINVQDTEELMLVNRGIVIEDLNRAYTRITGFVKLENGLYERFEQTAYNTMFEMDGVRESLIAAGFSNVAFVRSGDFDTPLESPEQESRVFILAQKPKTLRRSYAHP